MTEAEADYRLEIIQMLLNKGLCIMMKNKHGQTALEECQNQLLKYKVANYLDKYFEQQVDDQ